MIHSSIPCSPLEGERTKQGDQPPLSRGGYERRNIGNARSMRKTPTPWEKKLWTQLKSNAFHTRFRRQQPIGAYIVDFVSFEYHLIIELDGSQHQDALRDKKRDAYLANQGFTVLRFWNNQIDAELDSVLEAIHAALTPHASYGAPRLLSRSPSRGEQEDA